MILLVITTSYKWRATTKKYNILATLGGINTDNKFEGIYMILRSDWPISCRSKVGMRTRVGKTVVISIGTCCKCHRNW